MYGFLGLPYCTEQMTCDRFESDVENKRTLLSVRLSLNILSMKICDLSEVMSVAL